MKKAMTRQSISTLLSGLLIVTAIFGWSNLAVANNKSVDVFKSKNSEQPAADQAVASAKSLSRAFRSASEKVLPALVAIEVHSNKGETISARPPGQVPPGSRYAPQPQTGIGSGVIINSDDGLVLTNNHVVRGGGEIKVRLNDGREFRAAKVWTDPKTDLALVELAGASDLVAASIADSDAIDVGDWVLALGQPFGLESTVTAGIISAKHRGIGITARENFLQTDAAINPGNSGGPLVDLDGRIVGINTAISSRGGGNVGIGFAIPINLAKWVANELYNHGEVRRGYLGVNIQNVSAELASRFDVAPRQGVIVGQVISGSPAAEAGLQPGDVILSIGDTPTNSPRALQLAVERSHIGSPNTIKVIREGEKKDVRFVPRASDSTEPILLGNGSQRLGAFGLDLQPLTPELAAQMKFRESHGLVITAVESGSVAAQAGLQPGMILSMANRQKLTSVDVLEKIVKQESPEDGILFLVHSRKGSAFVVMKPS